MSATKLLKLIEKSSEKMTRPNDIFNSGVLNIQYKKTQGGHEFKDGKISICYGIPKQFLLWDNNKSHYDMEFTISSIKLEFDGTDTFKSKYITIKVC